MTTRGRYQGGYNANKVVMHITRVSKSSGTGGHDGRDLYVISHSRIVGYSVPRAGSSAGMTAPARAADPLQSLTKHHYPEPPQPVVSEQH